MVSAMTRVGLSRTGGGLGLVIRQRLDDWLATIFGALASVFLSHYTLRGIEVSTVPEPAG